MQPPAHPYSLPIPDGHVDDLAAVVVRRLEKPPSSAASWGLLKTLVLGIPSFGLLPLLIWPARFREYVADESQAMAELAEWAKLRGRQPAAVGPLLAAAEDTTFRAFPWLLGLTLLIFVVGAFVIQYASYPFALDGLLDCTYYHKFGVTSDMPGDRAEFLYRLWVASLSMGYVLQWLQVRSHAIDVAHFVCRFNPVAEAQMLPPVPQPAGRGWVYFRPLWILTAVILASYGAWWGIPMVLAGMAQRRYTNVTGRIVRAELAKRVKDIVALRQAPAASPAVATNARRCSNPRCLVVLRQHARFCTRCGSRTA